MPRYNFNNVTTPTCESPLSEAIRESVYEYRDSVFDVENEDEHGFLKMIKCPTGLGKTYSIAALITDSVISYARHSFGTIDEITDAMHQMADDVINIDSNSIDGYRISELIDFASSFKKNIDDIDFSKHMSVIVACLHNKALSLYNKCLEAGITEPSFMRKVNDLLSLIQKKTVLKSTGLPIVVMTDANTIVEDIFNETRGVIENHRQLTGDQKLFIKNRLVLIKNNVSQTSDAAESVKKALIKVLDEHSDDDSGLLGRLNSNFSNVRSYIELLKADNQKPTDKNNKEFSDAARELFRAISVQARSYVEDMNKKDERIAPEILDNLYELFPAFRLSNHDADVLYMTTDKWLLPVKSFPKDINFSSASSGNRHMLIIDEMDRQAGKIRNRLLQSHELMLIKRLKTAISAGRVHQLENSPVVDGVAEIMTDAIERVREAREKCLLEYSYDFDFSSGDSEEAQLFQSPGHTQAIVVDGSGLNDAKPTSKKDRKAIVLNKATENDRIINVFEVVPDPKGEISSRDFINVIEMLDETLKSFLQSLKGAVFEIVKNSRESPPYDLTIPAAVKILVSQYSLVGFEEDILNTIFNGVPKTDTGDVTKRPALTNSFHRNGFNHYHVTRKNASSITVETMKYGLEMSATGIIENIVKRGCEVIGISATLDSGTVVHDFDHDYLREILGKKYLETSKAQAQTIYDFYCQRRAYEDNGVKVRVEYFEDSRETVRENFGSEIEMKTDLLKMCRLPDISGDAESDTIEYRVSKLSKLLQAMKKFIEVPKFDARYMICFASRGIGGFKAEEEFLKRACRKYADAVGVDVEVFCNLNAAKLKSGEMDKIHDILANTRKKVIILTSYASLGAGKNPDYKPKQSADIKRLICVDNYKDKYGNSIPNSGKADVDTVYVELPTHMFPSYSDGTIGISTPFRMSLIYSIISMEEAGMITPKHAYMWAKSCLECDSKDVLMKSLNSAYMSSRENHLTFGNSIDYIAAVRSVIEQAVGRTARTANKRKVIRIFGEDKLISIIRKDDRPIEFMSHEYRAMVKKTERITGGATKAPLSRLSKSESLKVAASSDNLRASDDMMSKVYEINKISRHTKAKSGLLLKEVADGISSSEDYHEAIEVVQNAKEKAADEYLYNIKPNLWRKVANDIEEKVGFEFDEEAVARISRGLHKAGDRHIAASREIADEWERWRSYVLKKPTSKSKPSLFSGFYIEVPENQANNKSYRYFGKPEKPFSYRFFDSLGGSSYQVNEKVAKLKKILSNPHVSAHFKKNGFVTEWEIGRFMLAPVIFTNIYRPALAEQACEAILASKGFKIEPLEIGLEEKFDFIISDRDGNRAYVDVKFWNAPALPKTYIKKKINYLTDQTDINKFIFLNMFYEEGQAVDYRKSDALTIEHDRSRAPVMVVPGIMCGTTDRVVHIKEISNFIKRK